MIVPRFCNLMPTNLVNLLNIYHVLNELLQNFSPNIFNRLRKKYIKPYLCHGGQDISQEEVGKRNRLYSPDDII